MAVRIAEAACSAASILGKSEERRHNQKKERTNIKFKAAPDRVRPFLFFLCATMGDENNERT